MRSWAGGREIARGQVGARERCGRADWVEAGTPRVPPGSRRLPGRDVPRVARSARRGTTGDGGARRDADRSADREHVGGECRRARFTRGRARGERPAAHHCDAGRSRWTGPCARARRATNARSRRDAAARVVAQWATRRAPAKRDRARRQVVLRRPRRRKARAREYWRDHPDEWLDSVRFCHACWAETEEWSVSRSIRYFGTGTTFHPAGQCGTCGSALMTLSICVLWVRLTPLGQYRMVDGPHNLPLGRKVVARRT